MNLRPIGGDAPRLITAAITPRRARSQVASFREFSPLANLSERALMLMDAVSNAFRSEGGGEIKDELICCINLCSPPCSCPQCSRLGLSNIQNVLNHSARSNYHLSSCHNLHITGSQCCTKVRRLSGRL